MPQERSQEAGELGEFRRSFTPRRGPGSVMLVVTAICFVVGLLEFYTAIHLTLNPPETVLSDVFRQNRIMISTILGAIFAVLTVALLALYLSHRKHRVDLYGGGVVVFHWLSSRALAWDDIMQVDKEPIYGRSRTPVNWTYTLVDYNYRKTRFRGLDGLTTLGREVERRVRMSGGAAEE